MSAILANVTIDANENGAGQPTINTPNSRPREAPVNGQGSSDKMYDPSMLFLFELATALAMRDHESMEELSGDIIGYCLEILRQRKLLHPIFIQRILIYLLAMKKRAHELVYCTARF